LEEHSSSSCQRISSLGSTTATTTIIVTVIKTTAIPTTHGVGTTALQWRYQLAGISDTTTASDTTTTTTTSGRENESNLDANWPL